MLYNTCCVRENAENRALGNVIWLKELKKERPDMVIGVCGCMIQEEGVAERLQKQYPFIDLAFGTHNAYRFPEYLYQVLLPKEPGLCRGGKRWRDCGGTAGAAFTRT